MATDPEVPSRRRWSFLLRARGSPWCTWLLFVAIAGLAALIAGVWVVARADRGRTAGPAPAMAATQAAAGTVSAPDPSPIPVTPPPCVAPPDWTVHLVEAGDTLYSLAERYHTEVEALMVVNCLQDEVILVDQELWVPGRAARRRADAATYRASIPEQFTNIVLLGSDKREDASTWRTDTMIVLSVDSESDFVRLLSLPRDLWVQIPGHGEDRINTAEMWGELEEEGGGPDLVKETVYDSLGIPIHYYVRVDFEGFTEILDALGGVDIDVECPLPDIELTSGRQHMDGEQALLYARSRITTNDFDRNRRQRKLLMALWEQGLTVDIIPRLPALWKAMAGTFETDLPLDEVIALALKGLRVRPNTILSTAIGPGQVESWVSPGGADVLLPLDEEVQDLLAEFYAPPDSATLERREGVRVEVWNGTARPEASELAAAALHWAGFQVSEAGRADGQEYVETQILVYGVDAATSEMAAAQLSIPVSAIRYEEEPGRTGEIRIILGTDFDPCGLD